jgi:hypothetical protein
MMRTVNSPSVRPLIEGLEHRLCLSAEPMMGRYVGTDVGRLNGNLHNIKFILNVTSTADGMIVGTLSSPQAGILAFDTALHIKSDGKFRITLENGAGYLDGSFLNGNLKFAGAVDGKGITQVVSALDLKRNCGC